MCNHHNHHTYKLMSFPKEDLNYTRQTQKQPRSHTPLHSRELELKLNALGIPKTAHPNSSVTRPQSPVTKGLETQEYLVLRALGL